MHFYTAYALLIASELYFPELTPAPETQSPDVTLRLAPLTRRPPPDALPDRSYHMAPNEAALLFRNTALISVQNGSLIEVELHPNADPRTLRLCLLGSALSILLQQRQLLVLHGSALSVNNSGVCFLGDCGAGKSTTAAALHAQGHRLLTDDIVAIRSPDSNPEILPAYPHLRLCPDALENLGTSPESLPLVHPDETKRLHPAHQKFSAHDPAPLKKIYALEIADQFQITLLPPQEAFLVLLKFSFTARLLNRMSAAPLHLQQSTQLINQNLIYRLTRPKDLTQLPALVTLVEADLA